MWIFIDCAEHDKDFYGNDLNSDENDEDYALGAGKRDSVGQCQALCQSRDGCEFFTYKTSNKECWLKTSNSGSGYQSGAISGPKSCGNFWYIQSVYSLHHLWHKFDTRILYLYSFFYFQCNFWSRWKRKMS